MIGVLHSSIDPDHRAPILLATGREYLGSHLLARAERWVGNLQSSDHRRLLVQSNSAADVLTMLLTAEALGADLFIAHAALPDAALTEIIQAQGISAALREQSGPDLIELGVAPAAGEQRTSGSGRIFLMTSGTTGLPKIASHSLATLTARIRRTESSCAARWLLAYPPTTFAGMQVLLSSLVGGGTLVVPGEQTPAGAAQAASAYGVTHASGTPTFWRSFLISLRSGEPLPPLRHITLGGEAVDQVTLDRLAAQFPDAQIGHIYASTEAGALFRVGDRREGFPAAWLNSGVDGVELRVVDEILQVRSPRAMGGYVSSHDSPLTEDGWLSTGDLVHVEDGRVLFVGRRDTRINVGGFKIAPEEVEATLLAVDGVADVRVSGTKSTITGQVLVAEFMCVSGADAAEVRRRLIEHARKHLESYKVPRIVRIVDNLEMAQSGKKGRIC